MVTALVVFLGYRTLICLGVAVEMVTLGVWSLLLKMWSEKTQDLHLCMRP